MFRNPGTDVIVVLIIVLLVFGPKRLPALGKSLGTVLRELKQPIYGANRDHEEGSQPQIAATGESHRAPPRTADAAAPASATSVRGGFVTDEDPIAGSAEPARESIEVGAQRRS